MIKLIFLPGRAASELALALSQRGPCLAVPQGAAGDVSHTPDNLNLIEPPDRQQRVAKVLPGLEPGSLDSKSRVITATLQNRFPVRDLNPGRQGENLVS